jgi:hypothetical protein
VAKGGLFVFHENAAIHAANEFAAETKNALKTRSNKRRRPGPFRGFAAADLPGEP